jgi:hypothetical protein
MDILVQALVTFHLAQVSGLLQHGLISISDDCHIAYKLFYFTATQTVGEGNSRKSGGIGGGERFNINA